MKTVLFVVGPALGHVGRSVVIARALRGANPGLRIVFAYVTPGRGDRLLPSEFEAVPVPYRRRGDEGFADGLEQIIHDLRPDLIALDLTPLPWLCLARLGGIPRAYITNFFLTSLVDVETVQVRALRKNGADWNRRRRDRGLPELHDAKTLYDADVVLLCDPEALLPSGIDRPHTHHTVGPCIWQPTGALPPALKPFSRLLLVALGSTGRRPLPPESLRSLRETLHCDAIVRISDEPSAQEPVSGAFAFSGVPLTPILSRSALAVTQGGAGSTYAALMGEAPVAVWPSRRNHEIMAEVLTAAGMGAALEDLMSLEPVETRRTVADMKRRIAAAPTEASGPARAAGILLSML
ncbi:MAG: hypothetical protein CMM50_18245 [Rhodospirillaceae bacterium]|nr:hypothetical protein [Rhodospirillaceae bacterium]